VNGSSFRLGTGLDAPSPSPHIIVGAEAETADLVLDARQTGQDQDGRLDFRYTQAAQDFEARHIRKVEIEKDDVVIVNLTDVDTFLSEISRMNVETLGLEHQFD
jgi:hypothetical protein